MSNLVGDFYHNDGRVHQHNFVNTYLDDDSLKKPTKSIASSISDYTQNQFNKILGVKTKVSQKSIGNQIEDKTKVEFIRYTPNQRGQGHNSGASKRIVRMQEIQVDPLAPAQFKHKRVARGPPSPPTTIMRSPKKKLSLKDQQDWKIPPCISNWKNARGYTIPIDMRLSADGRTLQQHSINEKFAKFADTLYITERQARLEIEERNQIQQSLAYQDYLKRENEMRIKAKAAKVEQEKVLREHMDQGEGLDGQELTAEEKKAVKQRQLLRYITQREKERELRMARAGISKSKSIRDQERDISEKMALGQAQPTASSQGGLFDQRLMNQNAGLDSGFKEDDENIAYDKPLFNNRKVADLYGGLKNVKDDFEEDENQAEIERILKKRPHKGFKGADEKAGTRTKPVEFEKASKDFFGMEAFVSKKKLKTD